MMIISDSNFLHAIALGRVPGHSVIHKYGLNQDIDSSFETIWEGGGSYTGFDAVVAETVEVFSASANDTAAGTGARTIKIYGLDSSYDLAEETVTLSGVTAVDTVGTYIRVYRAQVITAGSGGYNAGIITIRQKTTTANVFAALRANTNNTLIGAYTIPNNKTGYLHSWTAMTAGSVAANNSCRLQARAFGEVFRVKEHLTVQSDGTGFAQREFGILEGPYTEKTDIFAEANSDVLNAAVATAFTIVLVDN